MLALACDAHAVARDEAARVSGAMRARRGTASGVVPRTKAERLAALRSSTDIRIPPFMYFTVGRWRGDRAGVLRDIAATVATYRVAVRSSAIAEDRPGDSHAGHYRT